MGLDKCVTAAVGAAIGAAALGTAAATHAVICTIRNEKENILTLTPLEFASMLSNPAFDAWFRQNLRCGQAAFARLCAILR
ncbi:hypothetical protein ON010_g1407 [Phytophthora cinnamomi]|nr:hypothetical protein ON010_g1407 [Phytophthora cinnamomi]